MAKKLSQCITILIIASIIHFSIWGDLEARLNQDPMRYENSANFTCGFSDQQTEMVTRHDMSMSFYNPNDFPVMVNNFISSESEDDLDQTDFSDRYLNVILSPKRNFEIDCEYIYGLFFSDSVENPQGLKVLQGTIRSKSIDYLDIALNYSSSSILKSRINQRK